ncbi:E3 ubiquitin-protein ligase EL5-like [Phragmites australis]|uniref:E3 ubiquitin-protein ligase EL5-like n=1 Tax=Phragmites australis TaxID=29695 RepID=UPI002D7670A4|nr:E3 ubiquitin-protein ligase EL5-like [Phragmites australis]
MTQDSDRGAGATDSSWPSGAVADPPSAPMAAAGAAMTVGSILTVAGILLLFVVFAFGLVSLQYCFNALDRQGGLRRHRVGEVVGNVTSRGVDPELLRSLPVTVYHAAGSKEEAVECAVCLVELEDGEEARFLPRCGHGFHAECVDMWLASHCTCPLCRLTVAKPDVPPAPALVPALHPVPPEPANYAANIPASVLLGVSGQGAVVAGAPSTSSGTTAALVIDIPELAVPTRTPRDATKSPNSARLRSIRRLWSFGRQGAGPSSSCTCGTGEGADMEQGISVTIGTTVAEVPLQSETAAGATQEARL